MPELPSEIDRINALTTNARNTWLVLLATLVFVGVILLDVDDIDFYGVDRATKLPLVDVSVPTKAFFYTAPILIAAIYGYFHLYLIRLWDALSVARPGYGSRPLGDLVSPWLVTDAALHLRANLRGDKCATPRVLEGGAMILNILLAWVFGIAVLGLLWWTSMTARDWLMTGIAGVMLSIALFAGGASLAMMVIRLRRRSDGPLFNVLASAPAMCMVLVAVPFILILSGQRTMGSLGMLAPIEMINEDIVERPSGWLPLALARDEFRDGWCKRKDFKKCDALTEEQEQSFSEDWKTRRETELRDLRRPDWLKVGEIILNDADLRGAILGSAFLVDAHLVGARLQDAVFVLAYMEGVDLSWAHLEGADFRIAHMEGARFFQAQMKGATLRDAQMESSDLRGAHMEGADLSEAQMKGATLRGAHMDEALLRGTQLEGVNLEGARLNGANFLEAQMEGADVTWAQMAGVVLRDAQMKGADFTGTHLDGADLTGGQMDEVDLSFSRIFGLAYFPMMLDGTNLNSVISHGAALRFVDLRRAEWNDSTDFRNALFDATVKRNTAFEARMGAPCQWIDDVLSEEEFLSIWRWWLEINGGARLSRSLQLETAPLPTEARLVDLGLNNCKPDQPFGPMPGTRPPSLSRDELQAILGR